MNLTDEKKSRRIVALLDPIFGGYFTFITLLSLFGAVSGELSWWSLAGPIGYSVFNIVLSQIVTLAEGRTSVEAIRLITAPALLLAHPYLAQSPAPIWIYYMVSSVGMATNHYFFSLNRVSSYAVTIYWTVCCIGHAAYWHTTTSWQVEAGRAACVFMLSALLIEISHLLHQSFKSEHQAKLQAFGASKLSALGEMAGGIAHEINNPLAIIKTNASQLQELVEDAEIDRPMVTQMAKNIEDSTERLARIVHGMRVVSREGSGDPIRAVSVRQMIDETLGLCREKFKSRGVQLLESEIDPNLMFEGRIVEMSQVLVNLLNNACDAIQGGNKPWIRVETRDAGDYVEISVDDSGTGVPQSLRQQIFQPFFTTKEIGKGTGLGLSISLGIVQNLGGELKIDESRDCSSFLIRLPKKQPAKKAA